MSLCALNAPRELHDRCAERSNCASFTEAVMLRKPATIICDAGRAPASNAGDWHDVTGHHRYYGSSAANGGERLVESRRGKRPRPVDARGF